MKTKLKCIKKKTHLAENYILNYDIDLKIIFEKSSLWLLANECKINNFSLSVSSVINLEFYLEQVNMGVSAVSLMA
jgi:hypothetical protein